MSKIIIYEDEFFEFYKIDKDQIHIATKSKEIQEVNDSIPNEEKLKRIDILLDYFYNFWVYVKQSNDKTMYTFNFDINLIMIQVSLPYFIKVKDTLGSVREMLITNLKETNIIIKNNLAKYFFDFIFTIYKPIKPVHII